MNLRTPNFLAAAAAAALLAACGGGGGYAGATPPTVSSASAGTPIYSQVLLFTVNGSNLDQGIAGTSAGCKNVTLSTTAPNVSTATTAYLRCTVSGAGAQTMNITRTSDGGVLTSVAYTVPLPQVTLTLSNGAGVAGNLVLTLEAGKAPLTVDNFLAYVVSGFYAGTVIHRNSPGFVLQGGGYAGPLLIGGATPPPKPTNAAIVLEDNAGLSNLKWTVAMARLGTPVDSATSQFFINLVDNTFLDRTATARGYAVFATVTTGTDFVTAMAAAPCTPWPAWNALPPGDCVPNPNLTVTGAVQTR